MNAALVDPIVQQLARLRVEQDKTQQEVGDQIGMTQSRVCEIESGVTAHPRIDTIRRYAAALGLDLALVPQTEGHPVVEMTPPTVVHAPVLKPAGEGRAYGQCACNWRSPVLDIQSTVNEIWRHTLESQESNGGPE